MTFTNPIERMIAQYLVDLGDDAGYLPPDLSDAAHRLGASPAQIEAAPAPLQTFHSAGGGARNLSERLGLHPGRVEQPGTAVAARAGTLEIADTMGFFAHRIHPG